MNECVETLFDAVVGFELELAGLEVEPAGSEAGLAELGVEPE